MSDRGSFKLILTDIGGSDWKGEAEIRIADDLDRVIYRARKRYSGPITFTNLLAVPRGRHLVHVKPLHYEPASRFIQVYETRPKSYEIRLVADHRVAERCGEHIRFPTVADLDQQGGLKALKEVLKRSKPAGPVVEHQDVLPFDNGLESYKLLASSHHRLAACLLNLYTKMDDIAVEGFRDDNDPRKSTWNLVDRLIAVRFDRIYAILKKDLDMDGILNWLTESKEFSKDPEWAHGVPQPEGFQKHEFTFKSKKFSYGTLQLTFSSKEEADGRQWALDADIDEKSGIAHWGEVIYHRLNSVGTSPYAVHQLLYRQGTKPPYELELRCHGPV